MYTHTHTRVTFNYREFTYVLIIVNLTHNSPPINTRPTAHTSIPSRTTFLSCPSARTLKRLSFPRAFCGESVSGTASDIGLQGRRWERYRNPARVCSIEREKRRYIYTLAPHFRLLFSSYSPKADPGIKLSRAFHRAARNTIASAEATCARCSYIIGHERPCTRVAWRMRRFNGIPMVYAVGGCLHFLLAS